MKIKVITSYKPGTWETYAKRGITSMVKRLPEDVDIFVYCEEPEPDFIDKRITYIDLNTSEPALFEFKNKYKNDPVANGELIEIPNGVRRSPKLEGLDKNKISFLWDAVKFSNKVFCIVNAVRNSSNYDYVVWLDADTYTHTPMPINFLQDLLPQDTMLTYLGRERGNQAIYPECGFVGYNLNHQEIQNFINEWEQLYKTGDIFNLLEWHDSAVFWHLSKKYKTEKHITVNDIGYNAGVSGHHVFVNSKLGMYIDHLKGDNRKRIGRSEIQDFNTTQPYWENTK